MMSNTSRESQEKITITTVTISDIIQTLIFVFPTIYLFGAILLWGYLDDINLGGEFLLLLSSSRILLCFALVGIFFTVFTTAYLLYAPSLLKGILRDNDVYEKVRQHKYSKLVHIGLFLFPMTFLLALSWLDNKLWAWMLYLIFALVTGYLYSAYINKIAPKNVQTTIIKNNVKGISYGFLVVILTFFNFIPIMLITHLTKQLVEGDFQSFLVLFLLFFCYSSLAAALSLYESKKQLIGIISILFFCSILTVSRFSDVAINSAKLIGIGHYCTDIVLKEKAEIIPILRDKKIIESDSGFTLSNIYVRLHKHKDEYIISKTRDSTPQRVTYANILDVGFIKECPKN